MSNILYSYAPKVNQSNKFDYISVGVVTCITGDTLGGLLMSAMSLGRLVVLLLGGLQSRGLCQLAVGVHTSMACDVTDGS